MKKIIAILLTLLMLVTAALPAMALDEQPNTPDEQPTVPQSDATVANIAGKTVTIDGVMSAEEGWASLPYTLLDNLQWIKSGDTLTNESPSKLYISTDGEYLYVLFTSTKENWINSHDSILYFNIDFATDELINMGFHFKGGKYDTEIWRYRYSANTSTRPDYNVECAINNGTDMATLEFKIELPDGDKELIKTDNPNINIGAHERVSESTHGDGGKAVGFGWNDALLTVTLPMVAAVPVVADVNDKKVTVDGSMGSAEGWAELPYMMIGATTTDGATASGNVSENFSNIRYSADANYIYAYYETSNMTSDSLYLQFAFDGKNAGADGKNYFLEAAIDLTENAESVISALNYGSELSYATGDKFYDGTSVAVKRESQKICVEIQVPIPADVAEKRLDSAVTVMVGVYEKLTADAADGYIPESGYNATAPNIELVLAKDEASVTDVLNKWLEDSKATANYANLTGLSVNVFGDSYFIGGGLNESYLWAAMLAEKYGWTLHNYGENDDMVSEYGEVDDLPMVKRYRQLPSNSPDLLIVTGGYYDFLKGAPLGESGSSDTKTYIGALNSLIDGLKAKYKDTAIVFVTPWNFDGTNSLSLTYKDYAEAMVATCEAKGVYCFKAYDTATSGINMQDADFRAQYAMSADDSYHLNLEGMKLAMPKIETFLNDSMTKWLAGSEEEEDGDDDTDNNESAPETNAPDANDKAEETTNEEDKGGCGSTVAGSIALVAVASLGTCLIRKKKED